MLVCGLVQIWLMHGVPGLSVWVVSTAVPVSGGYHFLGDFHTLPPSTHFPCLACCFVVTVFLSALISSRNYSPKITAWGALGRGDGDPQQTGRSDRVDCSLPLLSQSVLFMSICKCVSGAAVEISGWEGDLVGFLSDGEIVVLIKDVEQVRGGLCRSYLLFRDSC